MLIHPSGRLCTYVHLYSPLYPRSYHPLRVFTANLHVYTHTSYHIHNPILFIQNFRHCFAMVFHGTIVVSPQVCPCHTVGPPLGRKGSFPCLGSQDLVQGELYPRLLSGRAGSLFYRKQLIHNDISRKGYLHVQYFSPACKKNRKFLSRYKKNPTFAVRK